MAVQVSYPGVYIEEFAPAAPIQGVGTSTPAFIGVAARGPLDTPTKLTSWDAFKTTFGDQPVAGFYLWYALRGFFENGGQACYVVRASNGAYGTLVINTTAGGLPLFTIRAREPGAIAIDVGTQRTNALTTANTQLFRPNGTTTAAANPGDKQIEMSAADAARFRPGDTITLAALGERRVIVRTAAGTPNSTLLLDTPLANGYGGGSAVRLADAPAGTRIFRVVSAVPLPPNALVEGAMLTFEQAPTPPDTKIVDSVQVEQLGGANVTYRVALRQGLAFPVDMTQPTTVQSEEFTLTVQVGAASTAYTGLALDALHPRYYLRLLNGDPDASVTILPADPPPPIPMPGNMPANTALTALAGGAAENLATLADLDFIDALDTLRTVDDVNMIAVPDRITAAVQQAVIAHCELLADRFAVLDCRPGLDPFSPTGVLGQRAQVDSTRGYAALYYPWLRIPPAGRGEPILVPPSGHVCGIFARSDNARGVHKAPANEIVNGALGVERLLGDIDHGQLNPGGVNVVRVFQAGGRPVLYGARTTATDRNWQYVNIRRLFLYLEESIQEGIRWAVFEPNNKPLWKKLERSIGDFLNKAWRDGALFGAKAADAYYVRIDDDLNPFSEQALGRLHIEIGVRPSYPAEFIIVRIGIWAGGSEVTES
jgi:phage tail sheath protein FI